MARRTPWVSREPEFKAQYTITQSSNAVNCHILKQHWKTGGMQYPEKIDVRAAVRRLRSRMLNYLHLNKWSGAAFEKEIWVIRVFLRPVKFEEDINFVECIQIIPKIFRLWIIMIFSITHQKDYPTIFDLMEPSLGKSMRHLFIWR